MLDLPGSAGPRPTKKQKIAAPKNVLKGLAREVQSLGGDNPIAIVPEVSVFKKKRFAIRKPAAKWEFRPFKNSAREDNLVLRHWQKKIEPPPAPAGEDGIAEPVAESVAEPAIDDSTFAKFNVRVNIPLYDDELYKSHLESENWTRDETDYLMGLAQEYDLRWPVIWDRYEYEPPSPPEGTDVAIIPTEKVRTLEDLKDRYYKSAAVLMKARKPLETMNGAEFDIYEKMKNFSATQEAYRKQYAEKAFTRTKDEAKEEESLLLELKRILARSEKMSEERKELYARLEAPPSTGNIGVYTTSQGLTQLFSQLASVNRAKNPRRSIMGPEGVSPAGANGLQQMSSFDRRDSTARESISGPSGLLQKKGTGPGPTEQRQFTEEEERLYGVSHFTDRSNSGPVFRWEKLNKPISNKSTTQQARIVNTLQELGIPPRLIMPTADVGVAWTTLLESITRMLDMKKAVDKAAGELALAQTYKAEKEKKERAARGEPEPESEQGDAGEEQDGDVKMEEGGRESSAQPSARSASVHKRSASVLSSVSDKSTKRQKK
jgi:DNA methyltransferase 1-associated protein 1